MANTVVIRRGENGFVIPINIKQGGVDRALTDFVEADTVIDLKQSPGSTTILQLTDSDFAFNTPNIDWTITDAHTTTLPSAGYFGYVHLKNDGNSLEEIATFKLMIEEV